jgi:hypothetical protein
LNHHHHYWIFWPSFSFSFFHFPSPSFCLIFKKAVSLHFKLKSLMVYKRHLV